MSSSLDQVQLNLPPKAFSIGRFLNITLGIVAFTIISSVAVFSALGYKFNLASRTVEQTGLISLSTSYNIPADVYLNGVKQAGGIPFQIGWIFPGQYDIEVKRAGYQSWERTVMVDPNQRQVFKNIVLIYKEPQATELPVVTDDSFQATTSDRDGITIKENELWIDDTFVTRFSGDIHDARWFPGRNQVIFQEDDQLMLMDADGYNTQTLITAQTPGTIPYFLTDDGRVLVYKDGPTARAVALFEKITLIDRLAGDHPSPSK